MNTFTINNAECDEAVHRAGPNIQNENINSLYDMPMEMQVSKLAKIYIIWNQK